MKTRDLFCAALLIAGAACAKKPQPAPRLTALPARPLAAFATREVIVLPSQYLRPADSLGWAARVRNPREYLADVDDEIAFALSERGVGKIWVFADELARSAKRNAPYAPDPYALAAEWLRPPARRPPELLAEPLATQLRSLVAMHETRYALLPVEIRFEKTDSAATGRGRAVIHTVMLDARMSRIVWRADVVSDTSASLSPALAASVAGNLADLVAPPP